VKVGYYAQEHETLDFSQSLIEAVRLAGNMSESNAVSFLIRYLLAQQASAVGAVELERSRLQLALLVFRGPASCCWMSRPTTWISPRRRCWRRRWRFRRHGAGRIRDRYFLTAPCRRWPGRGDGSLCQSYGLSGGRAKST
jgi:hypothetical protein